jgi:hypothetical protein
MGALLSFVYVASVNAVEALSTEELRSHCEVYESDPGGTDGVFCVRYIQGFIDGAVVTDERVTYNVADEADRQETFTERAARTRVGARLNLYGPSVYAEFCLGEPIPLRDVVTVIVTDLLDPQKVAGISRARDVVYNTLRQTYPCPE